MHNFSLCNKQKLTYVRDGMHFNSNSNNNNINNQLLQMYREKMVYKKHYRMHENLKNCGNDVHVRHTLAISIHFTAISVDYLW